MLESRLWYSFFRVPSTVSGHFSRFYTLISPWLFLWPNKDSKVLWLHSKECKKLEWPFWPESRTSSRPNLCLRLPRIGTLPLPPSSVVSCRLRIERRSETGERLSLDLVLWHFSTLVQNVEPSFITVLVHCHGLCPYPVSSYTRRLQGVRTYSGKI